jgi:hypothetical protein
MPGGEVAEASTDLNLASARLEKAIAALESRVKSAAAKAAGKNGGLFQPSDGAREKALEAAALEASAALGRAAQEMRAALDAATGASAAGEGED